HGGASLRWKTTINLTKAIRKGGTLRSMVAMSNAGKVAEKAKEAEKRSMDVTMDMQESERSNSGMPRSKTGPAGQKKANPKSGQNGLQSVVMKLMGPKSDMNSTQSSFGAASSLGDFVPSTPGTAGSTEEVSFSVCAEDGQHFAESEHDRWIAMHPRLHGRPSWSHRSRRPLQISVNQAGTGVIRTVPWDEKHDMSALRELYQGEAAITVLRSEPTGLPALQAWCSSCGRQYANTARMRRHVFVTPVCQRRWGMFHLGKPVAGNPEDATQGLSDDRHPGFLAALLELDGSNEETAWSLVQGWYRTSSLHLPIRGVPQAWRQHARAQPSAAETADNLLPLLHPTLCCEQFQQPPGPIGEFEPPGPVSPFAWAVLTGPAGVRSVDDPLCPSTRILLTAALLWPELLVRRRSLLDVGRPAGSRWNQTWTATQEGSLSQTSRTDSRSQDERPGQWRMGDVSLPTTPRAALPALKESSKWMKVNKRVRDAILGHSGQSESLARDSKAAARRASQLPSLAGEDSQELGLEVRRPSLLRRDSFTAASAPQPASPRGVLAAAPAEPTPPPSVAQLASALIDHFGSLTRAYDHFDFSRKGRFSRAQFYAGCASVRLNFRTLSGLTVREIFKRMDDANLEDNPEAHRVAPRGEICRMKWMNFFETELQGSETAELLTADKGSEVERRLEERRKERGLQRVGEDSAPTSPSGQSGQTAPTVQTVAEVARARDVFMKRLKGIAESESREVNRSAEGSDSKGRGHLHPDRRMSSSKPRRISGTSGKGSSDDEDGAMARQTSGASSQPVQPMTTGRRGSSHGVGGRRRSSAEPVRRRSKQLRVETAPNLSNTQEDASASSSDDGLSDVEEEGKVPAKSAQELEAEFEGKDDEEVGEEDGLGALLQRSDDAVEERLRRVLQKGVGTKDFEVMDEAELQAVAEQEEIANVIQTIGASGKLALAWVFIKKLGSLKRAFKWFDTRNTRKIPQVVWDTGFTLLHIDAERLTGWRPFDIFKQIDTEPSDGTISYKEWNNFFADAAKTIALEMESLGGIDFEQQVKLRRHNLKLMRDKRRKAGNRAEDSWLDDLQEKQAMKQQEEEFTKRVRAKITALDEGQSFLFGRDWLCTAEEALLLLKPLKRSDIVQQVAESLGIWSLPSPALIDVREMLKFRPGLGGSQDPRMVQYSLQPVMEMPQDGLKVDKGGDSGSILVVNLTEFTKSTEDRLKEIPIHASEEFPTSLSELERGVVKTLAQRMGFACSVEKKGALFQITVFNVTGHFVKDMERQLRELEEGQGMRLSKELSDEERRLVKAMAEQMGYAVTQTSAGIEVTNLSTYAKQIREDLSQLGVGETQRIQLSSATDEQQVILQRVAAELGLDWEEEGTRRQRIATVGNMVSLVEEMREKLSDNTSSGTVLSFILPPTESQRETFFNMAQNYGFEPLVFDARFWRELSKGCQARQWKEVSRELSVPAKLTNLPNVWHSCSICRECVQHLVLRCMTLQRNTNTCR
ncbi:SEC1A, partial [Symbiodinium microadriaticum]